MNHIKRATYLKLLPCLISLLVLPQTRAVLIIPLSIQEMADRSELILHGVVLSQKCQRDPAGRIYTKIELQIKEVWKGIPPENPLTVVHGGGILGEERVVIPGQVEYAVGEEIVSFLVLNERKEAVTLGMSQGKFHVWKDQATGELLVRNPFHGTDASPAGGTTRNSHISFPMTLSALKAQVKGVEK